MPQDELLENVEVEDDTVQPEQPPVINDDEIVGDWNITEATEYAMYHAIDNEDFIDGDTISKVRFLNISKRTLQRTFPAYTIPVEAVYLFACVLNSNYNDTMVQSQRGAASFSVDGMTFTFKKGDKKELSELITDDIRATILEANPDIPDPSTKTNSRVKWVTL